MEEVYEQFSKWLDDPILKDNVTNLDARDEAVLRFASTLLKRTLSESFVGVPLTDGCLASNCKSFAQGFISVIQTLMKYCKIAGIPAEENRMQTYQKRKNREIVNTRSLSLELTKHQHRLASQLVCAFI